MRPVIISTLHKSLALHLPHPRGRSLWSGLAFAAESLLLLILLTALQGFAQLPPGWADQDIGTPSQAGSASYANGTWTVAGGGSDIWNNADQFHFAYNSSGGTTIFALVNNVQNTDPWAKGGVMFR